MYLQNLLIYHQWCILDIKKAEINEVRVYIKKLWKRNELI